MTRDRRTAQQEPTLIQSYMKAGRLGLTGDGVYADYLRRWRAWHAAECGRDRCDVHVDRLTQLRAEAAR